ncbi:MAG: alpha/beta fold hydrolase [Sporichthyaceae bacterium]
MTGAEQYYVEADGVPARVLLAGDPALPPLVLVHGITRTLVDWSDQVELLRVDHRVITLDLPGFGLSPRREEPATIDALARGLLATLDALDERRPAHLVGNSLGGAVSMSALAQAPERVASVTLVNSAGFGREATYLLRMLAIPVLGRAAVRYPSRAVLARAERALYADPALATRARVDHALAMARRPGAGEFFAELAHNLGTVRGARAEWREVLLDGARQHRRPMLIVWGDRDQILPISQFDAAREVFPHARRRLFQNTGHMPHMERPEEFAALLREFVAGVG